MKLGCCALCINEHSVSLWRDAAVGRSLHITIFVKCIVQTWHQSKSIGWPFDFPEGAQYIVYLFILLSNKLNTALVGGYKDRLLAIISNTQ